MKIIRSKKMLGRNMWVRTVKGAASGAEGAANGLVFSSRKAGKGIAGLAKVAKNGVKSGMSGIWKLYDKATKKIEVPDILKVSMSVRVTPKSRSYAKSEYEEYKDKIEDFTLNSIYNKWAKYLNEYILFQIFGYVMILDKGIEYVGNGEYGNNNEKKAHLMAYLYKEVNRLIDWLDLVTSTFPVSLDEYDKKWLNDNIFPLLPTKPVVISPSLYNLGASLSPTCNTQIRRLNEIERITSTIGIVLEREQMGFKEHVKDLGPSVAYPWVFITRMDDIANRVMPAVFADKQKRKAISVYPECMRRYNFMKSILPALIMDTQKKNHQLLSGIIGRDLKYLGSTKKQQANIKKNLLKRCLQLKGLRFVEFNITESISWSYGDICEHIRDMCDELDVSNFIPPEWEG